MKKVLELNTPMTGEWNLLTKQQKEYNGGNMAIRELEITDMNDAVDIAEEQAQEAGPGIGFTDRDRVIALIKKLQMSPSHKIIVSSREGRLIGFVVCEYYENAWNGRREGEILFIHVSKQHRQGFTAKDLLQAAEQWFREQDCVFYQASTMAYDSQYQPNDEYLDGAEAFYGKMMKCCGSKFIKEIV